MSLQKLTNNYADYNSWANSKFAAWLSGIDEKRLYEQVPSSFDSIDNTIQHIIRTQKFWADFVCERDVSKFDWSVKVKQARNNLKELKDQSESMRNAILIFTEKDLAQPLELNMPWAKNKLSRYEYILHVVNHSTFHRGQVITIARGISITENIPMTDYNIFNCQ
jgi:uncharacterized damage-inducible protein DinB